MWGPVVRSYEYNLWLVVVEKQRVSQAKAPSQCWQLQDSDCRSLHGKLRETQLAGDAERVQKPIRESDHKRAVQGLHFARCQAHEKESAHSARDTWWLCSGTHLCHSHTVRCLLDFDECEMSQLSISETGLLSSRQVPPAKARVRHFGQAHKNADWALQEIPWQRWVVLALCQAIKSKEAFLFLFFFSFFWKKKLLSCCLLSDKCSHLFQGAASEGENRVGKGAMLFSDYQNLMKIWTHPWVLKLAEIREENKVRQTNNTQRVANQFQPVGGVSQLCMDDLVSTEAESGSKFDLFICFVLFRIGSCVVDFWWWGVQGRRNLAEGNAERIKSAQTNGVVVGLRQPIQTNSGM